MTTSGATSWDPARASAHPLVTSLNRLCGATDAKVTKYSSGRPGRARGSSVQTGAPLGMTRSFGSTHGALASTSAANDSEIAMTADAACIAAWLAHSFQGGRTGAV